MSFPSGLLLISGADITMIIQENNKCCVYMHCIKAIPTVSIHTCCERYEVASSQVKSLTGACVASWPPVTMPIMNGNDRWVNDMDRLRIATNIVFVIKHYALETWLD